MIEDSHKDDCDRKMDSMTVYPSHLSQDEQNIIDATTYKNRAQFENKIVHNKNRHLYIIDIRYIDYGEGSLIKLIDSILNKASKILILYRKGNGPTEKNSTILQRYMNLHAIEMIKSKGKMKLRDKLASLVAENMNLYKKVTVLESMNLSEGITYKKSRLTSNKTKKRHILLIARSAIPSMGEIKEMRNIQAKKDNLLVWDIENVDYTKIDRILQKVYKKGDIVIVSMKPFSKKITQILFPYILLYGIKIYNDHKDSDIKIIEIVEKNHSNYKSVTIVSSDTDFVPLATKVLEKGFIVQMLLNDIQNKKMLQILKLDHARLRVNTL